MRPEASSSSRGRSALKASEEGWGTRALADGQKADCRPHRLQGVELFRRLLADCRGQRHPWFFSVSWCGPKKAAAVPAGRLDGVADRAICLCGAGGGACRLRVWPRFRATGSAVARRLLHGRACDRSLVAATAGPELEGGVS